MKQTKKALPFNILSIKLFLACGKLKNNSDSLKIATPKVRHHGMFEKFIKYEYKIH